MASSYVCPNPSCRRGNSGFGSLNAYLAHLRLSESCHEYLTSGHEAPDVAPVDNIVQNIDVSTPHISTLASFLSSVDMPIALLDSITNIQPSIIASPLASNESTMPVSVVAGINPVQPNPMKFIDADDFAHFSDSSDDSGEEDNSVSTSQTVSRIGYGDTIPFLMQPNAMVRPQQLSLLTPGDPNLLLYDTLETGLDNSEAQRRIISQSVEHKVIADLMMILELAGSPDYLLKSILKWARNANDSGFDFQPQALTRNNNLSWMYKMLPNSAAYCPKMVEVHGLETFGGRTHTRRMALFDFATIMTSLLTNTELMTPEFSVMNPNNPLAMCVPLDGKVGEFISGSVYRAMYAGLPPGENILLAPPVLFVDGTQFTSKGNRELIPVTVTLAIFNIAARRQRRFWRLLGYIPDPKLGMSSNDLAKAVSGYACRNFHRCMKVMLSGIRACQQNEDTRLNGMHLKLFGPWVTVDVKAPLLVIINDGPQGDVITGRFHGHNKGMQRHHRYCDTSFENLINTNHQCKPLIAHESRHIAEHGTPEQCQANSTYRHDNAFVDIDMGGHDQGIHLVSSPDTMHSIESGVMLNVITLTNNASVPTSLQALDEFGKGFATQIKQQILNTFPRMSFVHGATTTTFLSCAEKVGMMFLYTAALIFPDMHSSMAAGFVAKQDTTYHTMDSVLVRDAMEELLIYHAWLQRETYWDIGDTVEPRRCRNKIKSLINQLKQAFPEPKKSKGHHLSTSKVHEQFHTVDYMNFFGGTIQYNASTGESNHSFFAKDKAARSHNNHATMEQQTAHRITDAMVIESVHQIFHDIADTQAKSASHHGGTRYCVNQICDGVTRQLEVVFNTKTKSGMEVPPGLAQFLVEQFREERFPDGIGCLWCSTQYSWVLEGGELQKVRCHSNYNSGGCAHYDWAYIKFEPVRQVEFFPSRIVAVVDQVKNNLNTTYLVVQCCVRTLAAEARLTRSRTYVSNQELSAAKSKLFTVWMFSPKFELVPIEAYNRPCLAFWNTRTSRDRANVVTLEGVTRIAIAEDRSIWASKF